MDSTFLSSPFFCLTYKMSNYEDNLLRISVLKLSSRLPISTRVTPSLVDFVALLEISYIPYLFLIAPHEHLLHDS